MAQKQPTLKEQYRKERKRIQQFLRRAQKRGFYWGESPLDDIPSAILGKIPKRITRKSVESLKKKTAKALYSKAKWMDIETGESTNPKTGKRFTGAEGREIERSRASKLGQITKKSKQIDAGFDYQDIYQDNQPKYNEPIPETAPSSWFTWATLRNFRTELSGWNDTFQNTLNKWIDELIEKYGEDAVAQMLYDGRQNGLVITRKEAYHAPSAEWYMMEMFSYLPEVGDFTRDEMQKRVNDLFYEQGWYDEK